MYYFKFKLFLFSIFLTSLSFGFADDACLGGNFSTKVTHKVGPFSLLENNLKIAKDNCTITLTFKKWSLFEKKWIIDYCRMPVHIKYGTGSISVYKRTEACSSSSKEKSDYCQKLEELENLISDEGLIFAEGLKGEIESNHGKVYCTYLVIKSYLRDGIVYENSSQKFEGSLELVPTVHATPTEETF